jgi:Fe-S cluster assembly protein SufD
MSAQPMSALLDSFNQAFAHFDARDAAGLGDARREALATALRDGLPGTRTESWKYTSLRALERRSFASGDDAQTATLPAETAAAVTAAIAHIPAPRMVFIDGRYAEGLSDLQGLPEGVSLRPLSQVLRTGTARDANWLARRFERADEVFARFNAALADEGMVLQVEAGVAVPQCLHAVFVATAGADRSRHLRHLIDLRQDAALDVVEHRLAVGEHRHLFNDLMHVHLGQGARLRHARVQNEAAGATLLARTDAVLAREADYRRLDLELGAGLSRHELNVRLEGEAAKLHANGVLLADGRRHVDTRLGIEHIARDTACQLVWRGLGGGRGRAVFHGGITIREGADGSDADLSNKNLLLSADAEIDTQPVLIIHADEVKAAHGATVGQLDPASLFYLRSRGIPQAQARALLTAAFCRETLAVLDGHAAMRETLQAALDTALARVAGTVEGGA